MALPDFLAEASFMKELTARNCLVGTGELVKIGDFGLARCLRNDDLIRLSEVQSFQCK